MKGNRISLYALAGFLTSGLFMGGYWYFTQAVGNSGDNYLRERIERGAIRRTVSATGTLQAVATVQVGSQVSGRIQELSADFNSVVKRGQVLAVIDPANFEAQLERAQANLATAEAAVKMAEANLVNRKAELVRAKANLEVAQVTQGEARRQWERSRELFAGKLVAERDLENAQATFNQTLARVRQAEAEISQAEAAVRSAGAQLEQAEANVKQSRAELRMAEVNLRYTKITSPIDGVVIERNVDLGQTVAASFQAPLLFLIANDLSKMQVIAQIDEADIGAISEQAKVTFTVDAFPGETFAGSISEIRFSSKLPTTNSGTATGSGGGATNVVVYNVMIDVENPQLKLRPSMTANVVFRVAQAADVLKVPNAALRYRPANFDPEEMKALLADGTPQKDSGRRAAFGNGDSLEHAQNGEKPNRGRSSGSASGMQAVIGPSTTGQFGIKAGPKIRFPHAQDPKPSRGIVWVLDGQGQPRPRPVMLGITDGRETAVLEGDLKEGEEVITWEAGTEAQARTASPFGSPFGSRGGTRSQGQRGGR